MHGCVEEGEEEGGSFTSTAFAAARVQKALSSCGTRRCCGCDPAPHAAMG